MALADYLHEEAICMDLESRERDEVIRTLLDRLVAGGLMPGDLVKGVLRAILNRERLGSTAIGRGVAVPHARLEGLERILVAFGYSPDGVEFNALDGEPVRQVFLVIAPKGSADEYVGVMERITRLVQNADFRRFVSRLESADALLELVEEMDK